MSKRIHPGFTIVELLVVIAIIGLLIALMLPAVQYARESARRTACQNNLKQIGIALHNQHDSFQSLPPGWVGWGDDGSHDIVGQTGWGWAAFILPRLEQEALYDELDLEAAPTERQNQIALDTTLALFRCPSDKTKPKWQKQGEIVTNSLELIGGYQVEFPTANYVASFGGRMLDDCKTLLGTKSQCTGEPYRGMFHHNSNTRIAEVTDGTSQTIMVGERATEPEADDPRYSTWVGVVPGSTDGYSHVLGSGFHRPNQSRKGDDSANTVFDDFTSFHHNGAFFVFADGHVAFITQQIDHLSYLDLTTMDDTFSDQLAGVDPSEPPDEIPALPPPTSGGGGSRSVGGCPFCGPRITLPPRKPVF